MLCSNVRVGVVPHSFFFIDDVQQIILIMVTTNIYSDVLSLIQFLETHNDLPCSALRITDKANRRHFPEEVQEAILQLQYLLNEYFNEQSRVDALLKYCAEHQCNITYTQGCEDTWGLTTFFLHLSKGKIWFG